MLKLALLDQRITHQLEIILLKEVRPQYTTMGFDLDTMLYQPDSSLVGEPLALSPINMKKDGTMIRISGQMQIFYGKHKNVLHPEVHTK